MRSRGTAVVAAPVLLTVAGLVLSAIARGRQEHSRALYANNLKQLAVAVQNYHDTHRHLPVGTIRNPTLPPERRLSWLVSITPYLESSAPVLVNSEPWDTGENLRPIAPGMDGSTWIVGEWAVLICPGNPGRGPPGKPSVTHYVGLAGLGADAAHLSLSDKRCGVFGYERVLALEGVADGPANTILAAETMRDNGPWTAGGTPTLHGLVPEGRPYLGESGPFASGHGGRTNVAFLDGSVRPLTDSLAAHLFEAFTTIAGREDVSGLSWD